MTQAGRLQLSDRQRLAWLRLIRSESVGPSSFRQLISRFGSADAALEVLLEISRRSDGREVRVYSVAEAERELEFARKLGIQFVAVGETSYPRLLKEIDHPPPLVAVKGSIDLLIRPAIAIVGARNASIAGMKIAKMLARDISANGFPVVSGLARGIDTAAHSGALKSGTIAVFAGGLDRPYPPQNAKLADEIVAEGGALISEMPLGLSPRAIDFPRRNRLVSGLALGLIVVEAALRSGSLISARLAGEQGRLVFAVPGSPLEERCSGSNALLKDGATVVTEASDVLSAIAPLATCNPSHSVTRRSLFQASKGAPEEAEQDVDIHAGEGQVKQSEENNGHNLTGAPALPETESIQTRILAYLSSVPTDIDEIIRYTEASPSEVQLALFELQMDGLISRHSGNTVSLSG